MVWMKKKKKLALRQNWFSSLTVLLTSYDLGNLSSLGFNFVMLGWWEKLNWFNLKKKNAWNIVDVH